MGFEKAFHATATYASPADLEGVRRHINSEWTEQALEATGIATLRRRRLPAEQVIWVILGMGLFRGRPLEEIVSKLDLALPGVGTIAPSSVSQALLDKLGAANRTLYEPIIGFSEAFHIMAGAGSPTGYGHVTKRGADGPPNRRTGWPWA